MPANASMYWRTHNGRLYAREYDTAAVLVLWTSRWWQWWWWCCWLAGWGRANGVNVATVTTLHARYSSSCARRLCGFFRSELTLTLTHHCARLRPTTNPNRASCVCGLANEQEEHHLCTRSGTYENHRTLVHLFFCWMVLYLHHLICAYVVCFGFVALRGLIQVLTWPQCNFIITRGWLDAEVRCVGIGIAWCCTHFKGIHVTHHWLCMKLTIRSKFNFKKIFQSVRVD